VVRVSRVVPCGKFLEEPGGACFGVAIGLEGVSRWTGEKRWSNQAKAKEKLDFRSIFSLPSRLDASVPPCAKVAKMGGRWPRVVPTLLDDANPEEAA